MFFIGGKGAGGGGEGEGGVKWWSEYFSTFLLTLSEISANDNKYLNYLSLAQLMGGNW